MSQKQVKKIAVLVCKDVADKCSAGGCFRAFNRREDAFEAYDSAVEITGFTHCSGCDDEAEALLDHKLNKLVKLGVDTLHLSTCIRGRCHKYAIFADELSQYFDIKGYTHGSQQGKKKNNIDQPKKENEA